MNVYDDLYIQFYYRVNPSTEDLSTTALTVIAICNMTILCTGCFIITVPITKHYYLTISKHTGTLIFYVSK